MNRYETRCEIWCSGRLSIPCSACDTRYNVPPMKIIPWQKYHVRHCGHRGSIRACWLIVDLSLVSTTAGHKQGIYAIFLNRVTLLPCTQTEYLYNLFVTRYTFGLYTNKVFIQYFFNALTDFMYVSVPCSRPIMAIGHKNMRVYHLNNLYDRGYRWIITLPIKSHHRI